MVVDLDSDPESRSANDEHSRQAASFRDPSGFVFRDLEGRLLRQVNRRYAEEYRLLLSSGLYDDLVSDGLLIEHEEEAIELAAAPDIAERVIRPREVPFVSYPYEWSFGALKDAALLTLDVQRRALNAGMVLKDASAFNVQFEGSRPVFIDTLSFESYRDGRPWDAYGQFCRHFLAPLALMARRDIRLGALARIHLDGIPLDLTSRLLPASTRWNFGLLAHVHLHARLVAKYADTSSESSSRPSGSLPKSRLLTLLDNLRRTVERLTWRPGGTEWADYYENNSYTSSAFANKQAYVKEFLARTSPRTVWDLGANQGVFSRLATELGAFTCSYDIDPACVEQNYRLARSRDDRKLLPLNLDLTNPTPAIGWNLVERESFLDRGPCDTAMALALIHHLAISNNVPLPHVARHLRALCRHLIIEFVPKSDPQVRRLLSTREDIFDDYAQDRFEDAFRGCFSILEQQAIGDDGRVLYLMRSDA